MNSFLLNVSEDGYIKLPEEIVAALGKSRQIRVTDMGRYCRVTLPDGSPIRASVSMFSPDCLPDNGKILSVEAIKRIAVPIFRKYDIRIAWLFGSYARGDASSVSDIDIRLERGRSMGLEYIRFWRELQEALGKKAHLCVTAQLPPSLLEAIKKDEILLYDAESDGDAAGKSTV